MTLGKAPTSEDAFRSGTGFAGTGCRRRQIYGLLYRESHRLFPDESFADLFTNIGRVSVPPRIVAVVMVLQRLEGLSDREAVDRITFDLRWKYAAGGLEFRLRGLLHGAGRHARATATVRASESNLRDRVGGRASGWAGSDATSWTRPHLLRCGRDAGHRDDDPLGDPRAASGRRRQARRGAAFVLQTRRRLRCGGQAVVRLGRRRSTRSTGGCTRT